jgi:N-acetyl-gamma-glutamyl-phosphate reductase
MHYFRTKNELTPRDQAKVAIVGAHGYAGMELARLIIKHPKMNLAACFARDPNWKLSDELFGETSHGSVKQMQTLPMDSLLEHQGKFETLFFATPPEASLEWISKIHAKGTEIPQIIDLSGAYRLSVAEAQSIYGLTHSGLEVSAEYGLAPWSNISERSAFISNPGCFATSVLMAVIPLLKAGLVQPESLVMDCKSGTSGAGKKAQERLLFTEVEGECLPYRVGKHQHLPEINRYVNHYAGVQIDPIFVTSLLPVRRGIISGIYARMTKRMDSYSESDALAAVASSYEEAYSGYPLVRFGSLDGNEHGNEKRNQSLLLLRKVIGSARTHVSFAVSRSVYGTKLHVFSCIDNLLKGAASQAVENWNLSHGLPADCAMEYLEGVL